MKSTLSICSFLLLAWFISPFSPLQPSRQTNYRYAYAAQSGTGDVTIMTVAPTVPNASTVFLTESFGNNFSLIETSASPNAEWLTLVFSRGSENIIRLMNTVTYTQNDIKGLLFPSASHIRLSDQNNIVSWSPDSTHFAFNAIQTKGQTDTYLLSVNNNSLRNMTDDSAVQYAFTWLSNSRTVAVVNTACTPTCRTTIDLWDTNKFILQTSIDVSDVIQTVGPSAGATVCHLMGSPDGEFISFMTSCSSTDTGAFKEIYIVDVAHATVLPMTNFTSQVKNPDPFVTVFASYAPVWYDAQSLLIGTLFTNPAAQGTQTSVYSAPNFSPTTLMQEMVQEWAINPINKKLAFRSLTISPPSTEPQNAAIKIAALNGTTLDILYAYTAGCDLSWSPDGATLAYTDRGLPFLDCSLLTQRLVFVNESSGEKTVHAILSGEASSIKNIFPIGWIAVTSTSTSASTTG